MPIHSGKLDNAPGHPVQVTFTAVGHEPIVCITQPDGTWSFDAPDANWQCDTAFAAPDKAKGKKAEEPPVG